MEVTTTLLVLVGIIAYFWARAREKMARDHRDEMRELRFPILAEEDLDPGSSKVFVDFKEMLFVHETSGPGYHFTRVYYLRRRNESVWEIYEEAESRKRATAWLTGASADTLWAPQRLAEQRAELESSDWRPVFLHTLDVAYRRFLAQYRDIYDWDQTRVTRAVAAANEAARRERERARVAPVSVAPAPLPQGRERPSTSKLGAAIDVKGIRWGMTPHHVFSLFQDAAWEEEGQVARCDGEFFDEPALLRFRFTPSGRLHAVSVVTRHATLDEAWPRFLEVASALTAAHGHPTKDCGVDRSKKLAFS